MKFLIVALISGLSLQFGLCQQNRHVESGTTREEIHKKLIDASIIAKDLVYRFGKVDRETTEEFLSQAVRLDFYNLKSEIDKADPELIDEEGYEQLFVEFPRKFDDYLQQYLLREIIKSLEKAKDNNRHHADLLAFNAASASLNLIEACLLVQPNNKSLTGLKKQVLTIINETQFGTEFKAMGHTSDKTQ